MLKRRHMPRRSCTARVDQRLMRIWPSAAQTPTQGFQLSTTTVRYWQVKTHHYCVNWTSGSRNILLSHRWARYSVCTVTDCVVKLLAGWWTIVKLVNKRISIWHSLKCWHCTVAWPCDHPNCLNDTPDCVFMGSKLFQTCGPAVVKVLCPKQPHLTYQWNATEYGRAVEVVHDGLYFHWNNLGYVVNTLWMIWQSCCGVASQPIDERQEVDWLNKLSKMLCILVWVCFD